MVDTKKEKEPITQSQEMRSNTERKSVPLEVPTAESARKQEQQENLEAQSWIEKIEKKLGRVPKGAPGPQDDTVVVQQPQSNQPPVVLPVNQQQMAKGKTAPVESALAWIFTWAIRQIKMLTKLGRRVRLEDIPEVEEKKE